MRLALALAALAPVALAPVALGPAPAAAQGSCPDYRFEADGGPEGGVPTVYGCAGDPDSGGKLEMTCGGLRYGPSVFPQEAQELGAERLVEIEPGASEASVSIPAQLEATDDMLSIQNPAAVAVDGALRSGAAVAIRLTETAEDQADVFQPEGYAAAADELLATCPPPSGN